MAFRHGGERPESGPCDLIGEEAADRRPQAGVRDLSGEELEKAVQLVCIPTKPGRKRGRVGVLRGLERAHLELEPVAVAFHAAQYADRVALPETSVQELD